MKTLKTSVYLVMLCATVLFTACKSDDNNNEGDGDGGGGGGGQGTEFLTAKVDGVSFEAAQDPAVIVGASVSNTIMSFQGGKNNGETIRGTINGYNGVGTYRTGDNITNLNSLSFITISPVATWVSTFDIGSGTIEITSDDGTTIEGKFSFEGFNAAGQTTKNITQGNFKAIID
ncbi:MAG: hypothetical protein JKY22_11480 [Flavobacteriaceae bacterium]|nr:hypothetical protein [Flavobacteriaceae bacterium]